MFFFLCSHPHSTVVVPWQDNQRRIPSHNPPAGTSRWVRALQLSYSHWTSMHFFLCRIQTVELNASLTASPLSCCTGCSCWESVKVTPRRLCSHCAITRKSNISRYYRYAFLGVKGGFPLLYSRPWMLHVHVTRTSCTQKGLEQCLST